MVIHDNTWVLMVLQNTMQYTMSYYHHALPLEIQRHNYSIQLKVYSDNCILYDLLYSFNYNYAYL